MQPPRPLRGLAWARAPLHSARVPTRMSWRPPRSPSEEARELQEALAASLAQLRLEGSAPSSATSSAPAAAAAAAAAAEPEGEPPLGPLASVAPWAVDPAGVVHLPLRGAHCSWAQAAVSGPAASRAAAAPPSPPARAPLGKPAPAAGLPPCRPPQASNEWCYVVWRVLDADLLCGVHTGGMRA